MTTPSTPRIARREMLAWVLAGALGLALIGRLAFERKPVLRNDDPAVAQAREAITRLLVRDSAGARVPLAPTGAPAILMVNSRSCSFCRLALKDIAEQRQDRPCSPVSVSAAPSALGLTARVIRSCSPFAFRARPCLRARTALGASSKPYRGIPVRMSSRAGSR
jgi:hypothetical protein